MLILVNCIIDGVLGRLPILESLPKRYLSADLNPTSTHWTPVNRVAVIPVPRVNPQHVARDTQLPLYDAVREAALRLAPQLSIEARLQIHNAENDSCAGPPEPIAVDAHVFLRAHQNHPRELSRQRPDVLPAIVHSTPVIATFQAPDHHQAIEARPDIDRDNVRLTLHIPHG